MSIEEESQPAHQFSLFASDNQKLDKTDDDKARLDTDDIIEEEASSKDSNDESWLANTDEYQVLEEAKESDELGAKLKVVSLPSLPCDLENYRLTSLRAEGGTARVYRAYETHSKQPIAIKLLRRRFHTDQVIKTIFMRHGKALSQIELPHFHRVIDSGDSIWGSWWAMEWVEGETLTHMIKQGVRWESKRLLSLMSQLCDALIGLHKQGVIHGDLTPDNIIYYKNPRSGFEQLTLIDLALPIKLYQEQKTQDHDTIQQSILAFGQPAYLAPECLKGELPTSQSDLYGLGLIFFELCTGTPVYRADSPNFVRDLLEREAPTAASRQSPWPYPSSLDALISHLLSKNPSNRKLSVVDVKEQLSSMLQFLQKSEQYSKTEEFSASALSHIVDEVQSNIETQGTPVNPSNREASFKLSKTIETIKPVSSKKQIYLGKKELVWMLCGIICAYLLTLYL